MNTKKMIAAALMLAIGLVLPVVTMQVPLIGNMLLPMHIPVLLCGFLCGAPYGAVVGFVVPLLRSVIFGMPVMMPNAMAMSIELLCYGLFSGIIYKGLKKVKGKIYWSLLGTMLLGRIAWAIVSYFLYSLMGSRFTWQIFATQGFVNAVPGIVIQLIIIPVIVLSLEKITVVGTENE